jgi:hypothetical protein
MERMPYPIVIGGDTLSDFNATFQYRAGGAVTVRLSLHDGRTLTLEAGDAPKQLQPVVMYAADTTEIQPGVTGWVRVHAPASCTLPEETTGVLDDAQRQGVVVRPGVASISLSKAGNACIVHNPSGVTHIVKRGSPVAVFRPQHTDDALNDVLICDDIDYLADRAEKELQRQAQFDESLSHLVRDACPTDPLELRSFEYTLLAALTVQASSLANSSNRSEHEHLAAMVSTSAETPASGDPATDEQVEKLMVDIRTLPHLADIDLSFARKLLDNAKMTRLLTHILLHQNFWLNVPKEPSPLTSPATIEVTSTPRVSARTIPINPIVREQLRAILASQRQLNYIEPSTSPYVSSVLLVPKPGGKFRFVVDYRQLNKYVKEDTYPLPRVDEALSALHGATVFSSFDLVTAFWQVPLDAQSREYTAFRTPEGCYQYTRLPMGLKTASSIFCRFVDGIIGDLKWQSCLGYVDDILCYSRTVEQHLQDLLTLITRLDSYNLTANPSKCKFFRDSLTFLGHLVDESGVRPDSSKVEAVRKWEVPANPADLKKQIMAIGYYRRFIHNFASFTKPLFEKAEHPFVRLEDGSSWTAEELAIYHRLINIITSDAVISHPDWSIPFELHTDASNKGLGAMLVQHINGVERVISYASRVLTRSEMAFATWEKEALAVVWATRTFRMYLLGSRKFTIVTDNSAVRQLMDSPPAQAGGRLLRWKLALGEFVYEIKYRPGKENVVCDALSRFPIPASCKPSDEPAPNPLDDPFDYSHMSVLTGIEIDRRTATKYFGEFDAQAWSAEEVREQQRLSPECNEIKTQPAALFKRGFFYDSEGVLRRRHVYGGPDKGAIVVPKSLRAFYLYRHHTLPVAGHRGIKKTYALLKPRVWWPKMRQHLRRWIKACLVCNKRKPPRPRHAGTPGTVCDTPAPFHTWSVDTITVPEGIESVRGYSYILSCVDLFTRYAVCIPLRDCKSATLAQAIFDHIVCVHGRPGRLLSDDASNLIHSAVAELCTRWKIDQISTGPSCQHANPVERFHRTLNTLMTGLTSQFGKLWSDFLPAATFVYNASCHDSTGFSPYYLVFGRDLALLQDVAWDTAAMRKWPSVEAYHADCSSRLYKAYEAVVRQQARMALTNRRLALQHSQSVTFRVGDSVMLWEESKTAHVPSTSDPSINAPGRIRDQWKTTYTGPHTITKLYRSPGGSDISYTIRHHERAIDIPNVRANRLRLHDPWSDDIPSTSADLDPHRGYTIGGRPRIGDFVVYPGKAPHPFIIGKVVNYNNTGSAICHYYTNGQTHHRGTFLPAYFLPSQGGQGNLFVSEREPPHNYKRYTYALPIDGAIAHGFHLTARGNCIPSIILRVVSASPRSWWKLPNTTLGV